MATENLKYDRKIKQLIGVAKTSFEKMQKVLTFQNMNISGRLCTTKCYVWSTLLYGAETWTLSKAAIKILEAFGMWTYKKIMKYHGKNIRATRKFSA